MTTADPNLNCDELPSQLSILSTPTPRPLLWQKRVGIFSYALGYPDTNMPNNLKNSTCSSKCLWMRQIAPSIFIFSGHLLKTISHWIQSVLFTTIFIPNILLLLFQLQKSHFITDERDKLLWFGIHFQDSELAGSSRRSKVLRWRIDWPFSPLSNHSLVSWCHFNFFF